jgi:hypothetical protein
MHSEDTAQFKKLVFWNFKIALNQRVTTICFYRMNLEIVKSCYPL